MESLFWRPHYTYLLVCIETHFTLKKLRVTWILFPSERELQAWGLWGGRELLGAWLLFFSRFSWWHSSTWDIGPLCGSAILTYFLYSRFSRVVTLCTRNLAVFTDDTKSGAPSTFSLPRITRNTEVIVGCPICPSPWLCVGQQPLLISTGEEVSGACTNISLSTWDFGGVQSGAHLNVQWSH